MSIKQYSSSSTNILYLNILTLYQCNRLVGVGKERRAIILAFEFPAVTQFADILTGQQRRIFN